jgi:glyoxylase-like metal-dependent hydrolase (beta-lactamase superfamily II)
VPEARIPRAIPDFSIGPAVVSEQAVAVASRVARVTALNPSIMTGPGTNTYLVGSRDVAVIDPGPILDDHLDVIERAMAKSHGTIRWIAVTHHHRDHAPAARRLADRTGAELIAFGHPESLEPDRPVGDGFVLEAADFRLRALHTPGHASDHLCWLLEEEGLLFSGDHVMQGSTVVIPPLDGNMTAYLASLDRLLELDPPIAAIAPGHGRLIGDPAAVINAIVRHRLDREARVLTELEEVGAGTVDDLLPRVYPGVPEDLEAVARASLWAHLLKLALDGKARLLDDGESDPLSSSATSTWGIASR